MWLIIGKGETNMNKENKDNDDLDGFAFYLIVAIGIALLFIIGDWIGVPELQGVFG